MYQAKTNSGKLFEIEPQAKAIYLNGEEVAWDLVKLSDGKFHVILNSRSFNAEIVKTEAATKTFTVKVNGELHEISLKDKYDILLEKLGMNNLASTKLNEIKAPMPGLIFDIKVKEGDTVAKGDAIMILEAMKMENIIKSPGEGVVKTIKVKKGDSVEKNQILIQF